MERDTNPPLLSIVIVSYNVKDFLTECIQSVYDFIPPPFEIIVVDNASSDDTCFVVKSRFPDALLLENKDNKGFSEANNQGFRISQGQYLLLLNPDARLIDAGVKVGTDFLSNQENSNLILGAKIQNPDGTFQASAWKFPNLLRLLLESIFLNRFFDPATYRKLNLYTDPTQVDFLSGAGLLMRSKKFDDLDGFDENLFWMDDADLCYRNSISGGENFYFPSWHIMHHIGGSSKNNLNKVIANQIISKMKFYRKHHNKAAYLLCAAFSLNQILIRIIILAFSSLIIPKHKIKRDAYLFSFRAWRKFIKHPDQPGTV